MRMRHGVIVESGFGWAVVRLDGADVKAPTSGGRTLKPGSVATLVQDGRRMLALGTPQRNSLTPPSGVSGSPAMSCVSYLLAPLPRYSGVAVTKTQYFASTPVADAADSYAPNQRTLPGHRAGQILDGHRSVIVTREPAEGFASAPNLKPEAGQLVVVLGTATVTSPQQWRTVLGLGSVQAQWRVAQSDTDEAFTVTVQEGGAALIALIHGADNSVGPVKAGAFRLASTTTASGWGSVPASLDYVGCWSLFLATGKAYVNGIMEGYPTIGMTVADNDFTTKQVPTTAGVNAPPTPPAEQTYYGAYSVVAAGDFGGMGPGSTAPTVTGFTWRDGPIDGSWVVIPQAKW